MFANFEQRLGPQIDQAKVAAAKAAKNAYATAVASVKPSAAGTGYFAYTFGSDLAARSIFQWIFMGAIVTFMIFLILAVINFTMFPVFSFSPNDLGFIPVPTVSDKQVAYASAAAPYNVGAKTITGLTDSNYTIGVDVFLSGAFSVTTAPRVLLYRDTDTITQATADAVEVESDDATGIVQSSSFGSAYPNTNIVAWLDPIKNDLYVSVKVGTKFLHTAPIQNVPVKKVFALAIVFSSSFVEVYINGKLEQSMAITGLVAGAGPNTVLWPPTQSAQSTVRIANLAVWPRVLTAREVRAYVSSPAATNALFN